MKYIFNLIILLCGFQYLQAQNNNGQVTGRVADATTKVPVDYATITIFKQGSTSALNGTVTDTKGNFAIKNVPAGEYEVAVDFIGYQHKIISHVTLSGTVASVALGLINITPVQTQLKGVTITGTAAAVENRIDKMVYNAATDLTAQGGIAIDVLKKYP